MRPDPSLENPFEFAVSVARGEEGVVLMATRDVHVYLSVCQLLRVLVNGGILLLYVPL